jgi:hypothetical protein
MDMDPATMEIDLELLERKGFVTVGAKEAAIAVAEARCLTTGA